MALALAVRRLVRKENLNKDPLRRAVCAVSTGMIHGEARLDLAYTEDSSADVDFNFVLTDGGNFVEMQGTAEPFSLEDYQRLVALAQKGAQELFACQKKALAEAKQP